MNWFIVIGLIVIGSIQIMGTRGENKKTKEFKSSNQTVINSHLATEFKEELRKELDPELPHVDNKTHDELKEITTKITSAVSQNAYISKNFQAPDENILKLKAYDLLESAHNLRLSDPSSSQSSSTTSTEDISITHNIIESNIISELLNQTTNTSIWHPNSISTTHLSRELLQLNNVKQNFNYNFENFTHVKLWKLIKINLTSNLLVGLSDNPTNNGNIGSQLILISENGLKFEFDKTIAFTKIINEFEIIKIMLDKYLVTIENNTFINFYKIVASNDKYEIEKINEINLHKQILHLKFFYRHSDKIRLIFVTEFDGRVSADLYEFEIRNLFNFWLIKTIPLSYRCYNVASFDTGRDYIVAFPQNNEVTVFKYENDMFKQLETIKSDMVTHVSGFSMGGYSYLAVGGLNPQILRYHRGKFIPQSILSQSFGLVEQWFPISARTHRDDLLILVQHRINYTTHSLNVLEALIWNGESFNIVPSTPCYRNETRSKNGITCMIDIEQETDIAGSVIIQHGKNISILVPRGDEASQLFDLNIELVPVPNPLQQDINEFNAMYKILSTLVENFDNSIRLIENTIDNALRVDEYNVVTGNWEIETAEFENTFVDNDIKIGAAFVGEIPISKQESEFYLPFMDDILDELLGKLDDRSNGYRSKREENNIQFEFLNGIPADELLFATDDTIELNGVQEFEGSIYVGNDVIMSEDSKINGISIRNDTINSASEEVVLPKIECDEVRISENLHVMNDINGIQFNQENMGRLLDDGTSKTKVVEEMSVGGDLNFNLINKVDFGHFMSKIIFKNSKTRIDKLSIDGNIIAQTEFGISNLNEMPFPDAFVFRNSPAKQDIIRGHKVFTQSLVTNEIDTDGKINDIKPSDVVTLGGDQFIPGEITFSHIEVTENLEVGGTIEGPNFDKFLANPTIKQTNIINSSCIFNTLEIDGNVYLTEIENINFDDTLTNVVYTDRTDEFVDINALKIFDMIYVETDHFTVSSNMVNNKHSLDSYVTKSDSQIFNMKYLNGTVKLKTLTLTGLFNEINVTALDLNSIKIGGDQYIDKRIKFEHPIQANTLTVLEKINKKPISLLIETKPDGQMRIDSNFEIENLEIDDLSTNGNIQSGNGEVNDINLNEFNRNRFSLSRSQSISGIYQINSATIDSDLAPQFLNDNSMEHFNVLIKNRKNTISEIFSGRVPIHSLIVKGNATINNINGFNMDKIIQNVIWLDRPNTISNRLKFLDAVTIASDLEILSSINTKHNLNTVFDHLVYRDQPIVISGNKVFANGIKIYGACSTEYINELALNNLMLSNDINHVKNKIIINGNLQVNNLNTPYINDLDMNELTSVYHFDENTKVHYLNIDNVQFTSPQTASKLYVNGSINDVFNADELLENIVQLNKPLHFDENLKLFQHNLIFAKNLIVEQLNMVDLQNYFDHLVHIDEKDPVLLNGNIDFYDDLTVNHMRIGGDLVTSTILGYDPNHWLDNQYFINENVHIRVPLKFDRGTFQAAEMGVHILNGINMSKVLTYNTEQVFDDDFHVSEIVTFVPIHVGGLVNEINLASELKNTMMLVGNTTLKMPLHIENLNVHHSVKTPPQINGKNLSDILRIEPHMTVTQWMSFDEIRTEHIIAHDTEISGIDFERWYTQSLWKRGRETQTVISNYTILNVVVGEGGIHGTGLINNKSMNTIVEQRTQDKLKLENELLAYRLELTTICMNLRDLMDSSQRQIYYVKYFDDRIILDSGNSKIVSKLFFIYNLETYLLISSADCYTTIYRWDAQQTDFERVLKFQSGYVIEWGLMDRSKNNCTVLISHSTGDECTRTGVYMWRFNGHSILDNTAVLIPPEYEIKSLWTSDKFANKLFLITEGYNREPNVFQMNENGKIENQWKIPINHRKLQFLPTELIAHLALSDGSQLFLIDDYKIQGNRVKRHNWDALKEIFKPRQNKLLDNNRFFKIGTKNEKSYKRGLLDLRNEKPLVAISQDNINIVQNTETIPKNSSTTPTPLMDTTSKSELSGDAIEQFIDQLFLNISRISNKSVKNIKTGYADTSGDIVDSIPNSIATTTLNSVSQIAQTKLRVLNDSNVGNPASNDNLIEIIDVGYPHVKNISKGFVVTAADSLTQIQKLTDLTSNLGSSQNVNSEAAHTIYEGYKSVVKVVSDVTNATLNTVLQADELANKFELNNDKHVSDDSVIAARDVHGLGIEPHNNTNGSMIGSPLDKSYTIFEENAEKFVDATITNIAKIEDLKDKINHRNLPKYASSPDEFVIAPNPTYTTAVTPLPKTQYNLGANIFNTIRHSRIGDKNAKASTLQTRESSENFDRIIGQEITYNGVISSENYHIPEKGAGEIVVLHVGRNENRRMLTAVSTKTNTSTIPGKHDTIRIFDDILEGKIYQEILASKPTGVTVLHIGDQTILAFLEDKVVIQLFIYHGIEGFKNFKEYKLPMLASHLSAVTLPRDDHFACPRHFLVVTFTNKLWFLEAIMEGNCGIDVNLDCTLHLSSLGN